MTTLIHTLTCIHCMSLKNLRYVYGYRYIYVYKYIQNKPIYVSCFSLNASTEVRVYRGN